MFFYQNYIRRCLLILPSYSVLLVKGSLSAATSIDSKLWLAPFTHKLHEIMAIYSLPHQQLLLLLVMMMMIMMMVST